MEYLINEVFLTNYVMYDESQKKFMPLPRYSLRYEIVKSVGDGYYRNFMYSSGFKYKYYKECNNADELRTKIFYGNLIPIHYFLTTEELETGLITHERLVDVLYTANNVKRQKSNDNVRIFKR